MVGLSVWWVSTLELSDLTRSTRRHQISGCSLSKDTAGKCDAGYHPEGQKTACLRQSEQLHNLLVQDVQGLVRAKDFFPNGDGELMSTLWSASFGPLSSHQILGYRCTKTSISIFHKLHSGSKTSCHGPQKVPRRSILQNVHAGALKHLSRHPASLPYEHTEEFAHFGLLTCDVNLWQGFYLIFYYFSSRQK